MTQAEQEARLLLERYGFHVVNIEESSVKTPDFELFRGQDRFGYAECKEIVSKDDYIGEDKTWNRLSRVIHEAFKQLASVDPHHSHPRILIFINRDFTIGVADLCATLTGLEEIGGRWVPFGAVRRAALGKIKEEKDEIDLYIWMQPSDPDPYFVFSRGNYFEYLCSAFNIDPTSVRWIPRID